MRQKTNILMLLSLFAYTCLAGASDSTPEYPQIAKYDFPFFTLFSIPGVDLQVGRVKEFVIIKEEKGASNVLQVYTASYNGQNINTHQKTIYDAIEAIYNYQQSGKGLVDTSYHGFEKLFRRLGVVYKRVSP